MGTKIFLEVVFLIIINGFVRTFFKCLHDKFCGMCHNNAASRKC